jgi:4,5-DOPA dioxygenase extradiol
MSNHDSSDPLPTLFISHGAPLFALEPGETGPALSRLGAELRLKMSIQGVLIMSPHWMAERADVMTSSAPLTWHDFGGFPRPLYDLRYPAVGDPGLAAKVLGLLGTAGIAAMGNSERPLDHGAWVPLMHLFPQADIPVVQIALPSSAGPKQVHAIGAALVPLRRQGILVIGSGSMTHNLSEFFGGDCEPAPYVQQFSRWVEAALSRSDLGAMLNYRKLAPNAGRAHPTEDHFLPLFFALGAAGADARPHYVSREVMHSMLAMDAFTLTEVAHA